MKKRVKLISTIASLCLAVALMAFGVYAASSLDSVKVSGTISYTATGVDGYWEYVKVTPVQESSVNTCSVSNWTNIDNSTNKSKTLSDDTDVVISVASGKDTCEWIVEAKFVNTGSTNNVDVAAAFTGTSGVITKVTGDDTVESATGVAPAGNGVVKVRIKFTAADSAQSDTSSTWSVEFTAAATTGGDA